MADWTDGPEYAPSERPDVFVDPEVQPLTPPPPPARPAPAPVEQPEFTGSGADIPLAALVATSAEQRDPLKSFTVVATPLATLPDVPSQPEPTQPMSLSGQPGAPSESPTPVHASAWGAAHAPSAPPRPHDAWAPQQPMALPDLPPMSPPPGAPYPQPHANPQGFPTPADATWYVPNRAYPAPSTPQPIAARAVIEAADPITLACLVAGAVLPFAGLGWVAPALLVLAIVLGIQRIRYRRRRARNALVTAAAVTVVLAVLAATEAYRPSIWVFWDSLCGYSQVACWVLLPTLLLIVWGALRRGEAPTP